MKKLLTLLLGLVLLCLSPAAKAQVVPDTAPWCPPGATWVYSTFCPTCVAFILIHYEKDTIMLNKNAKVLSLKDISYVGWNNQWGRLYNILRGYEYLYESNDSVYRFSDSLQQFVLLYKFGLQVGDQMLVYNDDAKCYNNPNYPISDTLTIIETKSDTVNNRSYHTYTSNKNNLIFGKIIDKIGGFSVPFPEINNAICSLNSTSYSGNGGFFNNILCYGDFVRGYLRLHNIDLNRGFECDSLNNILTSTPNYKNELNIKVFPNPTSNEFYFQFGQNKAGILEIYDTASRLIIKKLLQREIGIVDILLPQKGIFIARFTDESGKVWTSKIVKL